MGSWQSPSWSPEFIPVDPRHVYIGPAYQTVPSPVWYQDPYRSPPPQLSPPAIPTQSKKYPTLNPILAEDTTLLRFDLKQKPSIAIVTSTYYTNKNVTAFASPTQKMRLVSKAFPWSIDIESSAPVTCGDVWEAMHGALQEPLKESEWGFIVREPGKKREEVEASAKKRISADPNGDKRLKRIDYLGETTLFRGLEMDNEFAKALVLPPSKPVENTWVIKLIS